MFLPMESYSLILFFKVSNISFSCKAHLTSFCWLFNGVENTSCNSQNKEKSIFTALQGLSRNTPASFLLLVLVLLVIRLLAFSLVWVASVCVWACVCLLHTQVCVCCCVLIRLVMGCNLLVTYHTSILPPPTCYKAVLSLKSIGVFFLVFVVLFCPKKIANWASRGGGVRLTLCVATTGRPCL